MCLLQFTIGQMTIANLRRAPPTLTDSQTHRRRLMSCAGEASAFCALLEESLQTTHTAEKKKFRGKKGRISRRFTISIHDSSLNFRDAQLTALVQQKFVMGVPPLKIDSSLDSVGRV